MRLSWFAPAAGPAARGAAAVLPALRRHAEVVIGDDLPSAAAWHDVNGTDATVYHLNVDDAVDGPVSRLLRLHPGVVVLHDHTPANDDASPVTPLLTYVAEEAAGVLVHSWPSYAFLQRRRRGPVIYRGEKGDADHYVRDLLHLIALVQKNRHAALGLRLATRAGAEMSAWVSGLADETAYRRVAEAIHALVA